MWAPVFILEFGIDAGSDSELTIDKPVWSTISSFFLRFEIKWESDDSIDNDLLNTESSSSELDRQTSSIWSQNLSSSSSTGTSSYLLKSPDKALF